MAENEGLFSNLRFSDIFFPAAASIASAYNPYIGYGLNTGMAMFNTMADFQHGLRAYKMAREQQRREEEEIANLRTGTSALAGITEENLALHRKYKNKELTQDYEQTAAGLDQLGQAPGAPLSHLPIRWSEMVGGGKQLDPAAGMEESLYYDDEYRALQEQLNHLKWGEAAAGASPGSVASMISGLGQQKHSNLLTKDQYQLAHKLQEEEADKALIRKTTEQNQSLNNQLETIKAQQEATAAKQEGSRQLVAYMAELYRIGESPKLETLSDQELTELSRKLNDSLSNMYKQDPALMVVNQARTQKVLDRIEAILAARTGDGVDQGVVLGGDGAAGAAEADAILNATLGSRAHP